MRPRQEKERDREPKPRSLKPTEEADMELAELKALVDSERRRGCEREVEAQRAEKMYRIDCLKNQNYKTKVQEAERYCEAERVRLTRRLIAHYAGNEDSPLFHNPNGLSPYDLMLLQTSKMEDHSETICMTCFADIELGSPIVTLPCTHILHRECGLQHLLYSKVCPGCQQEINLPRLRAPQ